MAAPQALQRTCCDKMSWGAKSAHQAAKGGDAGSGGSGCGGAAAAAAGATGGTGGTDDARACRYRHQQQPNCQQHMPVDSEGKACRLRLLSAAPPHMRSFHLAWLSHFCAVFATFAAAPLLPVIRDDLDMDKAQISTAGIAAVAGTILSRVVMGGCCDRWGPRYANAALHLLTACATFGMALVGNASGFLAARFFIGCSMASFVACQFWCSVMFTPRIVGTANAVAAGWGNSAGGFVQLLMPLLLEAMSHSQPDFVAWRTCYLLVGWMQVAIGAAVMVWGQDLPRGNYSDLRRQGSMAHSNSAREYAAACMNHRTWLMSFVYGFSFGVELTMNNVFSQYLYDTFDTSLAKAGGLAAVFGLTNLFSRPAGGMLSDKAAHRFGMRGRLWVLWVLQSSAAGFCCGLSQVGGSLAATMAMAVCMALAVTAASGATFGIIPFLTRRGLGAASGMVGSGASIGSILLQALFFTGNNINWKQGFLRMGLMSLGMTTLLFFMHFPMWGGMLPWERCCGGRCASRATEEDYYTADFTEHEKRLGLHRSVLQFAAESRSQRGSLGRAVQADGVEEAAQVDENQQQQRNGHCLIPSQSPALQEQQELGMAVVVAGEAGRKEAPPPPPCLPPCLLDAELKPCLHVLP